jgi:hypothetical protein
VSIGNVVCLERTQIRQDTEKRVARIVMSGLKTGIEVSVPIPPGVATELLAVANGPPHVLSDSLPGDGVATGDSSRGKTGK